MEYVNDPADPRRCKFSYPNSQCWAKAEPGCSHCAAHGGRSKANAQETRLYHLADLDSRRRLAELSTDDQIKSLREEIGIVRILIEKHYNAAQSDAELLGVSGSINHLIVTLSRLIKECHSLEQSLGELLSKPAVYRLAQTICQIVMEELRDVEDREEIIDRIAERIFPTIAATQNNEMLSLPAPSPPPVSSVVDEMRSSGCNDCHLDDATCEE